MSLDSNLYEGYVDDTVGELSPYIAGSENVSENVTVKPFDASKVVAGLFGASAGFAHPLLCPVHGVIPNAGYALSGQGTGFGVATSIGQLQEKAVNFLYFDVLGNQDYSSSSNFLDALKVAEQTSSNLYGGLEFGVQLGTALGIGLLAQQGIKKAITKGALPLYKGMKEAKAPSSLYLDHLNKKL